MKGSSDFIIHRDFGREIASEIAKIVINHPHTHHHHGLWQSPNRSLLSARKTHPTVKLCANSYKFFSQLIKFLGWFHYQFDFNAPASLSLLMWFRDLLILTVEQHHDVEHGCLVRFNSVRDADRPWMFFYTLLMMKVEDICTGSVPSNR